VGKELDDGGPKKDKIIVKKITGKVFLHLHDLKRLPLLFEGISNPI
jgi:hypothetical protein